jgi:hypothetical protein
MFTAYIADDFIQLFIFYFKIFVFSLNAKQDNWKFYNWEKVTTVVMVGYFDIQLVCWAHKYGARAIIIGKFCHFETLYA